MKYQYSPKVELKEGQNIHVDNLEGFYKFIYARQEVWYNRFVLDLPREEWTDNPIFKKTKYTNVYRELDRGTIWLFEHIRPFTKHAKVSFKEVVDCLWRICAYRLLNKVETFDEIGLMAYDNFHKEQEQYFQHIQDLLDEGFKVWTSAHITLQSHLSLTRKDQFRFILNKLHGDNFLQLAYNLTDTSDPKVAFDLMMEQYGFGRFTSYEVISDLGHINWIKFDNNTWANAGPGCIPGIKLIFPKTTGQTGCMEAMTLLRDYQEQWFEKLGLDFMRIAYDNKYLDLRNIEHSLCEYRKYWCEVNGVGRARPKFVQNSDKDLYIGISTLGV